MKAARRDNAETDIVKVLRAAGYCVKHMPIGAGFDLVVWRPGYDWSNPTRNEVVRMSAKLFLFEVKDPAKRNQLTPEERKLQDQGCPIVVVCTPEEALKACGG